jgi:hypothetical protein
MPVTKNQWELQLPNMQCVQLSVLSGDGYIEQCSYASEFGKIEKTQCLVVHLVATDVLNSQVQIQWG